MCGAVWQVTAQLSFLVAAGPKPNQASGEMSRSHPTNMVPLPEHTCEFAAAAFYMFHVIYLQVLFVKFFGKEHPLSWR